MKLLIKILFFILAIFSTNISEAKLAVFDIVVSETNFTDSLVENVNESTIISKNDFGRTCKNENDLLDFRNLVLRAEAYAAKTSTSLWPAASGGRTVINGIEYTTHTLERMQPVGTIMKGATSYSRGIPPSVVENAVKFGKITPGNTAAEVVRVITNPAGTRVISVFKIGN
jgi:hypothetical protein